MTSTSTQIGIWTFLGEEKNREFRENPLRARMSSYNKLNPIVALSLGLEPAYFISAIPSLLYVVRKGEVKKGAAFIFFWKKSLTTC